MNRARRWPRLSLLPVLVATGWLHAVPVQAAMKWPINDLVVGESSDLIHHLLAVARTTPVLGETIREPSLVLRFYMGNGFKPAWFDRDGVLVDTEDLMEALQQVTLEGLPGGQFHRKALKQHLARPASDPLELAQLDLVLTDAFFHYARVVRFGRIPSRYERHFTRKPDGELIKALEQALAAHTMKATLEQMSPPYRGYRRLRLMLARYRALERRGGWPHIAEGPTLKRGSAGERVRRLRWRLEATGDFPENNHEREDYYGRTLETAVRRFQRRHGLATDGHVGAETLRTLNVPVRERIGQLELNMERWRWLPHDPGKRYLLVNAADFTLTIYEGGEAIRQMRVIVGREDRPTPGIVSAINEVIVNPYWYVPETVLEEDLLPKLRHDPDLLARKHLKVFSDLSGNGKKVNRAAIDWTAYGDSHPFPYTLRQDPGPHNALGRVKFLLPNGQGIYLHDTPAQYLFHRDERALSSGCVRLDEPLSLARYVLGANGWGAKRFLKVLRSGDPTPIKLQNPIPVTIGYWTAWVNEVDELHFRPDIYQRDPGLAQALNQATGSRVATR